MRPALRSALLEVITVLFILLWGYAATSKLLIGKQFLGQLSQSPLLMPYAGVLQFAVPAVEYVLVLGLLLPRFRFRALYGSFFLMSLFSFYILDIMHFSPFIPCSCGGILDKMGWGGHLVFNIGFAALGAFGVLIHPSESWSSSERSKILLQ